jgi:hypothetical protein
MGEEVKMNDYLTCKEAKEQGIKRKQWKQFKKKPSGNKLHRMHKHQTQDSK